MNRADIRVLDSPLNHKHGRAVQLQQWRLQLDELAQAPSAPVLLIVDDTATAMKNRLMVYHEMCAVFGALPAPEIMNVDHGQKRYLIYRMDSLDRRAGCNAPALAYIDSPAARAAVPSRFAVAGWAFKDGAGLAKIEVTIDGKVVANAEYGQPMPNVAAFWRISNDPHHPDVGFRAELDAGALSPGKHWLGLRLHGVDGSVEASAEQPVRIEPR